MADTPRWKVLITDKAWPDVSVEQEVLAEVGAVVVEPTSSEEAALIQAAGDADAIITNWANVTKKVMEASGRCRTVARFGIGTDNIDIPAATALGIAVTNCPDYCVHEVSDHTLGLLLALARRIGFFHHRTKQGEYDLAAGNAPATGGPIRRLKGQTLGLVGLGHIARELVPKAQALRLNVIAHTRTGDAHGTGVTMVSFDRLLEESDFISIHAPATVATRGLFGRAQFAKMKPTAFLINTSRGALVDEAALWETLQRNGLAGAALDVFSPEPPDLSSPLFRDERVIVTPHAAFVSVEAIRQMRSQASQQVAAVLRGERPNNLLNPQICSRSNSTC